MNTKLLIHVSIFILLLNSCIPQTRLKEIAEQEALDKEFLVVNPQLRHTDNQTLSYNIKKLGDCEYVSDVEVISYGWELDPGTYDNAIHELRKLAVKYNSNVFVVNSYIPPDTFGSNKLGAKDYSYRIFSKLLRCPW